MSTGMANDLSRKAKREGDELAGARPLGWLARAGFVARGLVYLIIGVLALKLALGDGGKATNQQDALKTIADRPFGKTLLVLVAIGLAGYALWRLIRAAVGHGAEQRDSGSDRVTALASGIAYGIIMSFRILGPATAPNIRKLMETKPTTLALMHGSSFRGDTVGALGALADHYEARLQKAMGR